MKSIKAEAVRFLIAGAINTLATYLIYLGALPFVAYAYAFSISFVAGIVLAFVLYSSFVFRTPIAWRKLARYPAVYLVQYFAGLAVLALLIEHVGMSKRIAPLVSVLVLTPLTFVMNRRFLLTAKTNAAKNDS